MFVFNSDSFCKLLLFVKIAIELRQKLLEFSQKLRKTCKSEWELLFQNVFIIILTIFKLILWFIFHHLLFLSCSSCSLVSACFGPNIVSPQLSAYRLLSLLLSLLILLLQATFIYSTNMGQVVFTQICVTSDHFGANRYAIFEAISSHIFNFVQWPHNFAVT